MPHACGSRTPGKQCSVSEPTLHPKPGQASLIGINRQGWLRKESPETKSHCADAQWLGIGSKNN